MNSLLAWVSLCREKLRSAGGLDGLEPLWGGPLGAHDGVPEWMGGGRVAFENAEFCKNCFQISIQNCCKIIYFFPQTKALSTLHWRDSLLCFKFSQCECFSYFKKEMKKKAHSTGVKWWNQQCIWQHHNVLSYKVVFLKRLNSSGASSTFLMFPR